MRFPLLTLLATLANIATTLAQNPFMYNEGQLTSITAGTSFMITWGASTGTQDTVTLLLRQGEPTQLKTILVIASSIVNTGAFLWNVPASLVQGDLYTFEIVNDRNKDLANYSNQFSIISTVTVTPAAVITGTATAAVGGATGSGMPTLTGTGAGASATAKSEAVGGKVEGGWRRGVVCLGVVAGAMGSL